VTDHHRTLSIHVTDSQQRPKEEMAKKDAIKELASLDWHLIGRDEALHRLNVSPKSGLDDEQAKRRLATNGPNAVSPPKTNHLWK
jgi:sodium/potassium-transporting ATPase subunit alpha